MRTVIPIATGYYVDESPAVCARECVNLFPHIPESQTITDGALFGISGTESIGSSTGANDFCRGLIAIRHDLPSNDVVQGDDPTGKAVLLVQGNRLNRYGRFDSSTSGGVTTHSAPALDVEVGTITGKSRCFLAYNGDEVCIVDPDSDTKFNAWIYTQGGTPEFQAISDADFNGPASSVAYSDGYFIFSKKDSNVWFCSNLRDGLSYDATYFASAESSPDYIQCVSALRGIVFVFGEDTLEQYQNVGGASFPFERLNAGTYNVGCDAPSSVTEVNNTLVWIGGGANEHPAIWTSDGGPPQKISTASIEAILYSGGAAAIARAFSFHWAERGHSFVAFTVPSVCTVVYDVSNGLWHERKSTDQWGAITAWRSGGMVNAFSKTITADLYSGQVGDYRDGYHYEYGSEIRAYFTTSPVDNNGRPFSVYAAELMCQVGLVPINGQGSEPVIRLSASRDGGITYTPEISRIMGRVGNYTRRVSWPKLGRYDRSITLRWDISEPIKIAFVKAEVEIGR